MKEKFLEYYEEIKNLIKNKKYLYTVIIISILSLGFAVTHYSIGIDDLDFNRYIQGTYILSEKRWGIWILYNLFGIVEFSPFWMEFISALGTVCIAIMTSAFIKRETKDKKIGLYIIFSGIIISSPIINNFFLYQTTNTALVFSNIIVILSVIINYYNYVYIHQKKWYGITGILMTFAISTYESCVQTYVVMLLVTLLMNKEKKSIKEIIKFLAKNCICLIIGIVAYYLIGFTLLRILDYFKIREVDCAYHNKIIKYLLNGKLDIWGYIELFFVIIKEQVVLDINSKIFITTGIIIALFETIRGIKNRRIDRILEIILLLLVNIPIILIQAKILYRTQFSWIITIAFEIYILCECLGKYKIVNYIAYSLAVLMIIYQSRWLNQAFYNDYKRYEKEKNIAYQIANDLIQNTDYKNKAIAYYCQYPSQYTYFEEGEDSGASIMVWGLNAFEEYGTEITKFINSLGYSFLYIDGETTFKNVTSEYKKLDEYTKKQNVIEMDNYIIVNLDKYGLYMY